MANRFEENPPRQFKYKDVDKKSVELIKIILNRDNSLTAEEVLFGTKTYLENAFLIGKVEATLDSLEYERKLSELLTKNKV